MIPADQNRMLPKIDATVDVLLALRKDVLSTAPPEPPPVVLEFKATPASVPARGEAILAYRVAGADLVTVKAEPDGPTLTRVMTGEIVVKPTVPTTYTLRAYGPDGSVQATQAVTIGGTPSGSAATFLRTDATTGGSWRGAYGVDGHALATLPTALPAYAQVSLAGHLSYVWAASTADARALPKPSAADRLAACWYGQTFTIDVTITDGNAHEVTLYLLDWDRANRAQRIDVVDAATGKVLDTRTANGFSDGAYLSWTISGKVRFRITGVAGVNAVVSGIFFGPHAGH